MKSCKIIIIPTETSFLGKIVDKSKDREYLAYHDDMAYEGKVDGLGVITEPHHMYVVEKCTKADIREGDWYVIQHKKTKEYIVEQEKGAFENVQWATNPISLYEFVGKVNITTNRSLGECDACIRARGTESIYTCSCTTPEKIDKQLILEYVRSLNRGTPLDSIQIK